MDIMSYVFKTKMALLWHQGMPVVHDQPCHNATSGAGVGAWHVQFLDIYIYIFGYCHVSIIRPHFAFFGWLERLLLFLRNPQYDKQPLDQHRDCYARTHSGGTRTPAAAKAKLLSAKTEALASEGITGGSVEFCWQFWDGDFVVSLDAPQFIQANSNLSIPIKQTKPRIKHRPNNWESIIMSTTAIDQQNHLVIPTYTRFFHW